MYKSAKYKGSEVLQRLNKDEKESFEVVEKLSKGFTVKDDSALALDEVLAAILAQYEKQSKPKEAPKRSSKIHLQKHRCQGLGAGFFGEV